MSIVRFTIVGHASATSARILVCVEPSQDAALGIARLWWKDSAGRRGVADVALREAPPVHLGVADLNDLPAGETISYAVHAAPNPAALPEDARAFETAPERSFRLLPANGRPLRIAVVSCNGVHTVSNVEARYILWRELRRRIAKGDVDLIIFAGDQIYADPIWMQHDSDDRSALHPDDQVQVAQLAERYRAWYLRTWGASAIADVLASCPSVMMWDDHDIYDGWGSNNGDDADSSRAFFEAARMAFKDFQVSHAPPRLDPSQGADRGSFATTFVHEKTGFLLLDGRSHRLYPAGIILGDRQIEAAKNWLADNGHLLDHLFVVVGVPFVHAQVSGALHVLPLTPWTNTLTDDFRDAWVSPKNRRECARVLLALFQAMATNVNLDVTVLAGDVHVGALGVMESALLAHQRRGAPLRIHQVTSSGIGYAAPTGLTGFIIEQATKGEIELGDPNLRGHLLDLAGVESQVLRRRNFAIVTLADPDDPRTAERHGNLSVCFVTEHPEAAVGVEDLPQRLLGTRP